MRQLKKSEPQSAEGWPFPEETTAPSTENPFRSGPQSQDELYRAAGIDLDNRLTRANRRLNAISIGAPLAGTIAALTLSPIMAPSANTLAIFAVFLVMNSVGAGIGLHRYFTHRSFEAHPAIVIALGVLGTWAMQGPLARWVADHRRHHRFSDARFDPHSPYWDDESPIAGRFAGWAHAHFLWMLVGRRTSEERYAKDILKSPLTSFFTRRYWLVAASGLVTPAVIGFLIGGGDEALLCFLWAGCARVTVLHQLTWSVNSFGHMFGAKVEGAAGEARDNRILAVLMIGEGLHSYHHQHPNAAVNQPLALDLGGMIILGLEKAGLVKNVTRFGR